MSNNIFYQEDLLIQRFKNFHNKIHSFPVRKAKLEAFSAIVKALAGSLTPKYYLCPLDTGYGKSQTILAFLEEWRNAGFLPEGSVLVSLPRLDEVDRFASGCQLSKSDYAVVTSKKSINRFGLGAERANEARVLFTTQRQVFNRCREYDSFAEVEALYYQGKPRDCIIWDESLEATQGVTIQLDHLLALPVVLRDLYTPVVAELDAFLETIRTVGKGGKVIVPPPLSEMFREKLPWKVAKGLLPTSQQREAVNLLSGMGCASRKASRGKSRWWAPPKVCLMICRRWSFSMRLGVSARPIGPKKSIEEIWSGSLLAIQITAALRSKFGTSAWVGRRAPIVPTWMRCWASLEN